MSLNNNESSNNRNMIIAVVAFMVIMFGYNFFFEENVPPSTEQIEEDSSLQEDSSVNSNEEEQSDSNQDKTPSRRVSIENESIKGTINLKGAVLDGIILKKFNKTTDEASENVELLTAKGSESEYYYSVDYKINKKEKLSNELSWDIGTQTDKTITVFIKTPNGLLIERMFTLDEGYIVNIKDKITNTTEQPIKIAKIAELVRSNPQHNNYAVVHEGLVYNVKRNPGDQKHTKISEIKYSDVDKRETLENCQWIGYTDIYWLCTVLNKYDKNSVVSYSKQGTDSYKISLSSKKDISIAPNSSKEFNYGLFSGPKDIGLLKNYSNTFNIDKFEMSIDFGWFFMITKPLVLFLDILESLFGNMGLVILIVTLLFKILTYPLMKKSFDSAAKMREVQPKIASLQKMYSHDKMRMNQEMMALYKREKVSPMSGCLPMLLQAPIFFCLYKVFFICINMRHAPLFGWIQDLSAPDPLYLFNLFGLLNFDLPGFLKIGVWPLIMGITMFVQQKLSSASNSTSKSEKSPEMKMQENMMLIMPVLFTYICASFPVGVVVYWTISNVFSIVQQYLANKKAHSK